MTVLEVIQRSTDFLAKKGVESARLQTELLLARVLKLPRMQLYLNFERELTGPEQDSMRALVRRRGQREPLQHILGSISFCGLEIEVNRQVLIPRPETELLAEQGWIFLNQRETRENIEVNPPAAAAASAVQDAAALTALDFGTGTGCIAIALAAKCRAAKIVALDISAEALEVARRNAVQNDVAERLTFIHGNGLAALPRGLLFDLVVANPPYIPSAEIERLQPEVREYDPRVSLDGGPDGLDFFRSLADASNWLKPGGKLMVEFGDGQENNLAAMFENENWIVEQILKDYTQRPRILIARKNRAR